MIDELLAQLATRTGKAEARDYAATIASLNPLEVIWRGEQLAAVNGLPNWPHAVGDNVRVTRFAQQLVISATMASLPTTATVTAVVTGAPTVTVQAGGNTYDVQVVGSTPAVGNTVTLMWATDGGYCLGKQATSAAPLPPAPTSSSDPTDTQPAPTPPTITKGSATLYAQQTATFRSGSLRTDGNARYWLYQGHYSGGSSANNSGFWYYGSQRDKVRGVTVTDVKVWLKRLSGAGMNANEAVHLVLHSATKKGSSAPSTTGSYTSILLRVGEEGWYDLPNSWGQALADRTSAGIGVVYAGTTDYMALAGIDGPSREAKSGALKITYTRS